MDSSFQHSFLSNFQFNFFFRKFSHLLGIGSHDGIFAAQRLLSRVAKTEIMGWFFRMIHAFRAQTTRRFSFDPRAINHSIKHQKMCLSLYFQPVCTKHDRFAWKMTRSYIMRLKGYRCHFTHKYIKWNILYLPKYANGGLGKNTAGDRVISVVPWTFEYMFRVVHSKRSRW